MSGIGKLFMPAALLVFLSCAKEIGPSCSEYVVEKTFTAVSEEGKTVLDGMSVSWVAGDRVAVWDGERICNFRVDSSGVSSVIRGQAAETDDYILKYPFNVLDSFSDGAFNMVVPVNQRPVAGGFDPSGDILAARTSTDRVVMRNACGLLRFRFSGSDVAAVSITAVGGECLAGTSTLSIDGSGIPVLSGMNSPTIMASPASGRAFTPGTYSICAAPAVLAGGIEIRLQKADGKVGVFRKASSLEIRRGSVTELTKPLDELEYSYVSGQEDISDTFLAITKSHPYLFADDGEFARHKAVVEAGKSRPLVLMHNEVMAAAGRIVASGKVMSNALDAANKRMLTMARDALGRIFICAYAYRFTGDARYAACAEALMNQVCDFPDWNAQNHYLDTATLTQAVSVGYDWLYDYLSEATKAKVEAKVFDYSLNACLTKAASYLKKDNAWNQTVTGGLTMGGTVFYKINPELCTRILDTAIKSHYAALRDKFGPDGSYPSGTMYWNNGADMVMLTVSTLRSVYMTDFGITDYDGYRKTPMWYLWMCGNTKCTFSFGDSNTSRPVVAPMFYFAALYDNPAYAYFEIKSAESGVVQSAGASGKTGNVNQRVYPLILLWASKCGDLTASLPEGRTYSAAEWDQPVAVARTGWGENDLYLGIKGGQGNIAHGHLDAGSICFDAYGQRWSADAVQDSYAKIEAAIAEKKCGSLWDMNAGSARWKCFSINNRQHSTITINDTDHNPNGNARITEVIDGPDGIGATVDFNRIFAGEAARVTRTALIRDDSWLEVTDRIVALDSKAAAIRWNLCAKASASIVEGGIKLTAGNVSMLLSASSTYPLTYELFTNDPKLCEHPSPVCESENVQSNYSYCGFRLTVPAGKEETIVVRITRL